MAVYWLMGSDGKRGFSLGVDSDTWAVKGPSDFGVATPEAGRSFFKMAATEKKLAFLFEVDCVEFQSKKQNVTGMSTLCRLMIERI